MTDEKKLDGWKNELTGLGYYARDKRNSTVIQSKNRLTEDELERLYTESHTIRRVVDIPAREMLRKGFKIKIDGDPDTAVEIEQDLEDMQVRKKLTQALKWSRVFGGSVVMLGALDGQRAEKRLREDSIRSFDWLTVLTPRDVWIADYYGDPLAPRYGEPELYQIQPSSPSTTAPNTRLIGLHESRALRFDGLDVTRYRRQQLNGWGESVIHPIYETVRDHDSLWEGVAHIMQDFAQGVFKVSGLAAALSTNRKSVIRERLELMDEARSIVRALILDADNNEDFERKVTPLTGVHEVLGKFMLLMAAAAEMPVSLLYGQDPAGLNASGDANLRYWYDKIASAQENELRPQLERLIRLKMLAKGLDPDALEWSVEFEPLWQLDEKEQADVRLKHAQADQIEWNMGAVSELEIRDSRHGGDVWSPQTTLQDLPPEPRDLPAPTPPELDGDELEALE